MNDPLSLQAANWKAKLAGLRSHYVPDDDPRVAECLAALSFWRLKNATDRAVSEGLLSPELAADFIAGIRRQHIAADTGPRGAVA